MALAEDRSPSLLHILTFVVDKMVKGLNDKVQTDAQGSTDIASMIMKMQKTMDTQHADVSAQNRAIHTKVDGLQETLQSSVDGLRAEFVARQDMADATIKSMQEDFARLQLLVNEQQNAQDSNMESSSSWGGIGPRPGEGGNVSKKRRVENEGEQNGPFSIDRKIQRMGRASDVLYCSISSVSASHESGP